MKKRVLFFEKILLKRAILTKDMEFDRWFSFQTNKKMGGFSL